MWGCCGVIVGLCGVILNVLMRVGVGMAVGVDEGWCGDDGW